MDRLSPLSATFLLAEDVDPRASLAIGSLAVFEGPAPTYDEFVGSIAGRLPLIPRYRQRLARVPFDLAAPVWVDDPDFDISRHVLRAALPRPGGPVEVGELLSQVMTRRMDRSRPLWEYWFCEGLVDGRWGVLSKLHHSLVDGVSGSDLYQLVLDPTPEPRDPVPDTWEPAPLPSWLRLATDGTVDLLTSPLHAADAARRAVRSPVVLARRAATAARGVLSLAESLRPVSPTTLTGPLVGARCYRWLDLAMEDIAEVRHAFDVTVNDVALAALSGGYRELLDSRGEPPGAHTVRSLVPVSTWHPGEQVVPDNQVSLLLPYLPVEIEDPVARLAAVHERVAALRHQHEPEGGTAITSMAALSPFPSVAWGVRLGLRLPQHQVSSVTTNVPGPPMTLYALGREAVAMLPYVPIADRVRTGVAMFSYRGTLTLGLTGDLEDQRGLQVLAEGVRDAMDELLRQARLADPSPVGQR